MKPAACPHCGDVFPQKQPNIRFCSVACRILGRSNPRPDGCRQWTGYLDRRGYGRVGVGGKITGPHRAIWIALHGEPPPGFEVDHMCFNPACVNPEHLRLLPAAENARLQRSTLRTHCRHGHEFSPENTYIDTMHGKRVRRCRKCNAAAQARRKLRIKAAKP